MPNQIFFIQDSKTDVATDLQCVFLPHPKYGKGARYLTDGTEIMEMQRVAQEPSSWFLGNFTQSNGGFYVTTRIDPLFLAVPFLINSREKTAENEGKFMELKQIFVDAAFPQAASCLSSAIQPDQLVHICDQREGWNSPTYRLNDGKLIEWLKKKVDRLCPALSKYQCFQAALPIDGTKADEFTIFRRDAIGLLSEYLPKPILEQLLVEYGLPIDVLAPKKKTSSFNNHTTADADTTNVSTTPKQVKEKPSAVASKLAAINTAGMKSLSSYFMKPKTPGTPSDKGTAAPPKTPADKDKSTTEIAPATPKAATPKAKPTPADKSTPKPAATPKDKPVTATSNPTTPAKTSVPTTTTPKDKPVTTTNNPTTPTKTPAPTTTTPALKKAATKPSTPSTPAPAPSTPTTAEKGKTTGKPATPTPATVAKSSKVSSDTPKPAASGQPSKDSTDESSTQTKRARPADTPAPEPAKKAATTPAKPSLPSSTPAEKAKTTPATKTLTSPSAPVAEKGKIPPAKATAPVAKKTKIDAAGTQASLPPDKKNKTEE